MMIMMMMNMMMNMMNMIMMMMMMTYRAVIALSAAAVQAEFALEPGLVTLVKFSSGNKPPVKVIILLTVTQMILLPLKGIIDVPMKLKDLIKEMRHQGRSINMIITRKNMNITPPWNKSKSSNPLSYTRDTSR